MNELKPCAHCGGTGTKESRQGIMTYFWVECKDCFCSTGHEDSEQAAIDDWNRRPEPKALTLEELKQMEGKPYYHVSLSGNENKWVILPKEIANRPEDYDYGKTWIAYDREPERSEQ